MLALCGHFSIGAGESSGSVSGRRRARLATIGATTAKYIREEVGLEVDAVADEPKAESLVLSLLSTK